MKTLRLFLWLVASATLHAATAADSSGVFNVRDYGAIGDGKHLETAALNQAVTACAKAGGGVVYLPPGIYLTGTIVMQSHVTLEIAGGATILGSENPKDYLMVNSVWSEGKQIIASLIYAENAENITITGRGKIDGQGQVWWQPILAAKAKAKSAGASTASAGPARLPTSSSASTDRPQLIRLVRCKDIVIERINLTNSPEWNIHPLLCEFVRVDGVTIQTPVPSPNTDGINPESCRNVQILNCRIDTGDDCVTLKSGQDELGRRMGKPSENITIMNCVMLHGHGGVTIGSEMSGGVRNVTVTNCVFQGTDNGIRIKSQRGRGGVVEGLAVTNVAMQDVPHPFLITAFYMGNDRPTDVFPVNEGTPRFRDFLFSNITARGAKDAGSVMGLREMPVENLTFNNVHIQAATGFTCTNAQEISFQDVVIDTDNGPALIQRSSSGVDTARLRTKTPHEGIALVAQAPPAN
ncbi:MAG: glycoside hydrolase family 28 protein [Abitibacteriaceae bacterium]|nr:glycoside hydrolase family 28 protein [Abditibacteriaceae bacterium]